MRKEKRVLLNEEELSRDEDLSSMVSFEENLLVEEESGTTWSCSDPGRDVRRKDRDFRWFSIWISSEGDTLVDPEGSVVPPFEKYPLEPEIVK